MSGFIRFLKTEPALIAGFVQALLSLLIGAGVHVSAAQSGVIVAVISAAAGLVVAVAARPFAVPAVTGFATAIGALLLAYKVPHVSAGLVTDVNAFIVAAFGLFLRSHLTPKASLPQPNLRAPSGHYPRTN